MRREVCGVRHEVCGVQDENAVYAVTAVVRRSEDRRPKTEDRSEVQDARHKAQG